VSEPELTVEAFAAEFIHIKGAHKGPYETGEMLGIPCEWCLLAARQAVEAVERIRAREATTTANAG
jgi:hypothetical protein